jgi:hypothetical protein
MAVGIGSKLASSKPQVKVMPGPAISSKLDMTQPAIETKHLI